MAIKPQDYYVNANAATPSYPNGSIKNDDVPGDESGTLVDAALQNDMIGFGEALMAEAGVTASGTPDNALASDRLNALKGIIRSQGGVTVHTVSDAKSLSDDVLTSLVNSNQRVTTVFNKSSTGKGGANYIVVNSSSYTGTPDGYTDHYAGTSDQFVLTIQPEQDTLNAYQCGATDAGSSFSFRSTEAILSTIFKANNIRIPQSENGLLVIDTLEAGTNNFWSGDGSIRNPHIVTKENFGNNKPAFDINRTSMVSRLNFRGSCDNITGIDTLNETTAGYGLQITGTGNRQWTNVTDIYVSGYHIGLDLDSSYYTEFNNINAHGNNVGIKVAMDTEGAAGSSPIKNGHIRDNKTAGIICSSNNDLHISDTVFEFNRTHVIHTSGLTNFEGCYLDDGPFQIANVTGGWVTFDGKNISSFGSGGNIGIGFTGTDTINKKTDYHCGGVEASGDSIVVFKNYPLIGKNIYSNFGVSDGTRDNGSDFRFTGNAKAEFYDVKVKSYFPFSYDSTAGSLRGGDLLNNYFINGLFDREDTLQYDIVNTGAATVVATEANAMGRNKVSITKTGVFNYGCRFSVPKNFVGKTMAMCVLTGLNDKTVSSRNFNKSGFTVVGPNFSETGSDFWVLGGLDAVSMAWYTVEITSSEGFAALGGTVTGESTQELYGFILTEVENYQKFGNYQDAWVRRVDSAVPAFGTWEVTDEIINSTPTSGNTRYTCSVAGTPGTWVTS